MTFGERVKARRLELGMTLQDVANRTDTHRGPLSMIENNLRIPGVLFAQSIAIHLETDLNTLMGVTKPKQAIDKPRKKRTVKK